MMYIYVSRRKVYTFTQCESRRSKIQEVQTKGLGRFDVLSSKTVRKPSDRPELFTEDVERDRERSNSHRTVGSTVASVRQPTVPYV